MSTKRLLNDFIDLKKDLNRRGPDAVWNVRKKLLNVALQTYLVTIQYEKIKTKTNYRNEFLESDKPLTKRDKENIELIVIARREINKKLKALKEGK